VGFTDAVYLTFDYGRAIKFCTCDGGRKVLEGVRADVTKSLMSLVGCGAWDRSGLRRTGDE